MTSILVKLFEHNRWANLRAVEACAGLTDTQLDAAVPGTAGPVRETLMHIAGAEQRYVGRLSGRQPTYSERDGWPGAEQLRRALDESGHALIELAERADSDEVLTGEHQGRSLRAAGRDRLRPGDQPRDRAPLPDRDDPDPAGRRATRLLRLGLGELAAGGPPDPKTCRGEIRGRAAGADPVGIDRIQSGSASRRAEFSASATAASGDNAWPAVQAIPQALAPSCSRASNSARS